MSTRSFDEIPPERFRTSDGVSICYRVWGDVTGRPVVLQHGFASDTNEDWARTGVIGVLVHGGFRVIGVDARGHGASDAPHDADAYGMSRFASDLLELTAFLETDKFDLVGYSMGAVIATTLAASRPEILRRLVLGGIGCSLVELGGLDTRVVPLSVLADTFRTDDLAEITDPGLLEWRTIVDTAGWDRQALALVAESTQGPGAHPSEVIAPTLLLTGDVDPFAANPSVVVQAMTDARLIVLPGDHTQARYSPLFAASIIEFLTSP